MSRITDKRIRFYVKLVMGIVTFAFFLYYTHVEVQAPGTIDRWIFLMLLGMMGGLLGVDMFGQSKGGGGNTNGK